MSKEAAVRLSEHVWRIPTFRFDLVNSFAFQEDDGKQNARREPPGVRRAWTLA